MFGLLRSDPHPIRSTRRLTRAATASFNAPSSLQAGGRSTRNSNGPTTLIASSASSKPKPRMTRNSLKHVEIVHDEDEGEGSEEKRTLRVRKSRPNYALQPPSNEGLGGIGNGGGREGSGSGRKGGGGRFGGSSRSAGGRDLGGGGYGGPPWNGGVAGPRPTLDDSVRLRYYEEQARSFL